MARKPILINRLSKFSSVHSADALIEERRSSLNKTNTLFDCGCGRVPWRWIDAKPGDTVYVTINSLPCTREVIEEIRFYRFGHTKRAELFIFCKKLQNEESTYSDLWVEVENLMKQHDKCISNGKSLFVAYVKLTVEAVVN